MAVVSGDRRAGNLFFLGDHRTMSTTAATSVPSTTLIYGKAVFGYWPMEKLGRYK